MLKKLNLLWLTALLLTCNIVNTATCPKDKSFQDCGCLGDACDPTQATGQLSCCVGTCDEETKTCNDGCKTTKRGCNNIAECCPGLECNGYCAISTKKTVTALTAKPVTAPTAKPVTPKTVVMHKK